MNATDDQKWTRTNELRQVEWTDWASDNSSTKRYTLQQKFSSNLDYGEYEWRDVSIVMAADVCW